MLVAGILGLGALLVAFSGTWIAMADVWSSSETFNHGFLVAPITVWLIWRQRALLSTLATGSNWAGLVLLVLMCLIWLVAELAGINVLAAFAATLTIPALVLAVFGRPLAWSIALPLAFLLFMVPAGDGLTPLLMEATADATIWAVAASGVPVYREGLHFTLPTGRWSVVEACSGLRYVIAAGLLSTLFAYLNFVRLHKRVLFIVVALVIAVVANWIRAYLIVMIGHLSGMRLGVGEDHVWYGWLFFGITMFAVFWMGARWQDAESARTVSPSSAAVLHDRASQPSLSKLLSITIGILFVLGATRLALFQMRDVTVRQDLEARADNVLGPFTHGPPALQPRFAGARHVLQAQFDTATATDAYVAYFARQEAGAEMVAFGNTILDSSDRQWQLLSRSDLVVDLDGTSLPVREWRVRSGSLQRVVWSWYTIGGRPTNKEYQAKVLTAWAMLTGRGDHSTVSAVGTRLPDAFNGSPSQPLPVEARDRLEKSAAKVSALARSATTP